MNAQNADSRISKLTKNPARLILLPIGSLLAFFGLLLIASELATPSRLSAYELPLDCAVMIGGIALLYLAICNYTPMARLLTISLGFVAFWMAVIVVQNEPPRDAKELAICIAGIALPSYIYLIAYRSKSHQGRTHIRPLTRSTLT